MLPRTLTNFCKDLMKAYMLICFENNDVYINLFIQKHASHLNCGKHCSILAMHRLTRGGLSLDSDQSRLGDQERASSETCMQ